MHAYVLRMTLSEGNICLKFLCYNNNNNNNINNHIKLISNLQIGIQEWLQVWVLSFEHVHFENFLPPNLKRVLSTENLYS